MPTGKANDVISSENGEDLQFKQPCKFGDSNSNRFRDIRDSVYRQVGQSVSLALQNGGNVPSEYHSINNHVKYCDDSSSRLEDIRVFAFFKMAAWKLVGNS